MSADLVSAVITNSRRRTPPHRNVAQFRRERHPHRLRLRLEHLEDRRLLSLDFGFANAFTSNISEDQWASDAAVDAADNVDNTPPVAVDDAYNVAEDQTLVTGGAAAGWQTLAAMPTPRSALAAAALDGLLYTAGGTLNGGVNTSTAVEAYDPASNTWIVKPSLPTQTTDAAAAVLNGELYVIGGWPGSVPTSQVQIYSPATNAWRNGTAMPTLSACAVATELDGKLYVLTACVGYGGFEKRLDMYDPGSNTWTSKAAAPHVHAGAGTAVIGGKWYVAGGGDVGRTDELPGRLRPGHEQLGHAGQLAGGPE